MGQTKYEGDEEYDLASEWLATNAPDRMELAPLLAALLLEYKKARLAR